MTANAALVHLVKCPYCPPRVGVLTIDTDRVRGIDCWKMEKAPKVGLRKAVQSGIVVFDPDMVGGRPCPHLIVLAVHVGWMWAEPTDGMLPMGSFHLHWSDPRVKEAVSAGWSAVDFVLSVVRGVAEGDPPQPQTPFRLVEANVANKSVGPKKRPCNFRLLADAIFTPDPTGFAAEL